MALGIALWLAASPAGAQAPRVALELDAAPEGCIDRARLAAQVAAILDRDAFADEAPVRLRVRLEAVADRWRAALTLLDARGEVRGVRQLTRPGASCAVLDGPLAIVAALLVDVARTRVDLHLPEPAPARAEPERSWQVAARASALSSFDLLPEWSFGVALRAEVRSPSGWPVVVALSLWPSGRTPGDGRGAEMTAFGGALGTCAPLFVEPRWQLRPCAAVELGGVRAVGRGAPTTRESLDFLASARLTAELEVRVVGPLVLSAAAGVVGLIVPPTYVFQAGDDRLRIHEPGPLVPWLELGVGVTTF